MSTPIQSIGPALGGGLAPAAPSGGGSGQGFGGALLDSLDKLNSLQDTATQQSQALATGKAQDVSTVAMDVERASLALQLAVQVRNKAVDAYQEIFRMQV